MFDWISFPILGGYVHAKLCTVAALSGEWEVAREHALEAIRLGREFFLPHTYLHRHHDIEALLQGGHNELARESLGIFERRTRGQKSYFRLAYLRAEAVFARWDGDTDKTLSLLYEALRLAERLGLPGEIWQVGASLGEVHEERGETGPAEQAFDRSAVVVRKLASKISDRNLREGFLAAPQTRLALENSRGQEAEPGLRTS